MKVLKKVLLLISAVVLVSVLKTSDVKAGVLEDQAAAFTLQYVVNNVYMGSNEVAATDPNFINIYNATYPLVLEQYKAVESMYIVAGAKVMEVELAKQRELATQAYLQQYANNFGVLWDNAGKVSTNPYIRLYLTAIQGRINSDLNQAEINRLIASGAFTVK